MQRRALHQRHHVGVVREGLGGVHHVGQRLLLQIGHQRLVVPGRGRISGQEERVRQLVAMVEAEGLHVDRERHQHHAIDEDVVLVLQVQ